MKDIVQCRSCKARMFWGTSAAGKSMPIDAEPVADGNIFERDGVFVAVSLLEPVPEGVPRWKSHFATCPNSAKHRKGKS